MKAGTKLQRHIVEIDKTLPKINEKQKEWAYRTCLEHCAVRMKSGKITCLDCAHSWQSETKQAWHDKLMVKKCPNCKAKINIEQTQKKRFSDVNHFQIIDTHKKHQVIRTFQIKGIYFSGEPAVIEHLEYTKASRHILEVSRIYIAPNGKYEIIGHTLQPSWSGNRWTNEFCLKNRRAIKGHDLNLEAIYGPKKIIKEIRRNGFKNNFYESSPFNVFHSLLKYPKAETLLKINEIELFKMIFYSHGREKVEKYWSSLKLSFKYKYKIKSISNYFDYLNLLLFFGKDINSPKFACPVDLHKEHNKYVERKRRHNQNLKLEERKAQMIEDEITYSKHIKKYSKLEFTNDKITVRTMHSVALIQSVGNTLKHCIYASGYYERTESILLCAWIKNKPIETIEYNLRSKKVIQSRGLNNKSSRHHKKILQLMFDNQSEILKCKKPVRKKQKAKPKKLVAA